MNDDDIKKAVESTTKYLYGLEGKYAAELAGPVGMIRQLWNETGSVGSQMVYDILEPAIEALLDKSSKPGSVADWESHLADGQISASQAKANPIKINRGEE